MKSYPSPQSKWSGSGFASSQVNSFLLLIVASDLTPVFSSLSPFFQRSFLSSDLAVSKIRIQLFFGGAPIIFRFLLIPFFATSRVRLPFSFFHKI